MISTTLLSQQDRKEHYRKIYTLMDEQGVDGLLVSGDGPIKYVNGEYAAGWGVFALIPRQGEPIFFQGNEGREYILTPVRKNAADYWIKEFDVMTFPNIVKAVRDKGLDSKTIGLNLEALPMGLYMAMQDCLDQLHVKIKDISEPFKTLRRCNHRGSH